MRKVRMTDDPKMLRYNAMIRFVGRKNFDESPTRSASFEVTKAELRRAEWTNLVTKGKE